MIIKIKKELILKYFTEELLNDSLVERELDLDNVLCNIMQDFYDNHCNKDEWDYLQECPESYYNRSNTEESLLYHLESLLDNNVKVIINKDNIEDVKLI